MDETLVTYSGGCHCGAVRFRVFVDKHQAFDCNCSICQKKGFLHLIVTPERFTLRTRAKMFWQPIRLIQALLNILSAWFAAFTRSIAPDRIPINSMSTSVVLTTMPFPSLKFYPLTVLIGSRMYTCWATKVISAVMRNTPDNYEVFNFSNLCLYCFVRIFTRRRFAQDSLLNFARKSPLKNQSPQG